MIDLARFLLSGLLTVTLGTSAVILLLLVLHRPLGRLRASTRHLLWLLVLLRLALPLTLPLAPLGLTLTLPDLMPRASAAETTASPTTPIIPDIAITTEAPDIQAPLNRTPADTAPSADAQPPVAAAAPESLPFPDGADIWPSTPLDSAPFDGLVIGPDKTPAADDAESTAPALSPPVSVDAPHDSAAPVSIEWTADTVLPLLAALWLSVAALLFALRMGRGLSLNRELVRQSKPLHNTVLAARFAELSEAIGLHEIPQLRVSSAISSPLVYGFAHPTVLLPEGLDDPDVFCSVARHELTHIRRRDLAFKPLALAVLSLHWFNPLVYLAVRRFDTEAELACDAEVLANCDDNARRQYGRVLLSVLRRDHDRRRTELTTHFHPNRRTVRARFENILDATPKSVGRGVVAIVLALCLAMGSLVACRLGGAGNETPDTGAADATDDTTPPDIPPTADAPTQPDDTTTTPATPPEPTPSTDDRERIVLDFTPVEPVPAETNPLCAAGETAAAGENSTIRVTAANGNLINTWTLRHGWQGGLAIAEDQNINLALLWSAEEGGSYATVELPIGAKLITKQACALGNNEQLVCVAYEINGELGADGFVRRDGKLYRVFRAVYTVELTDLEKDGFFEFIGGISYTNRIGLWTMHGGKLCFTDPAAAICQTSVKSAQVVSSAFDENESANHFIVTLQNTAGETETVRAQYVDGTLRVNSREKTADIRPQLTGDVYLRGFCSEMGQRDLILHATPDRVYYVYYYDGDRLMYETGLTSIYESGIYFWQHYGLTVGMHHFGLESDYSFRGDEWGNFRFGDRAVAITAEEYAALEAEYKARLEKQANDTSIFGTVRLSTPIWTGEGNPDILRVRVVNGSEVPIKIGYSYTLERRQDDMWWHHVIENGTPRFSATRFTIAPGAEAVIDLDLSVYTAMLSETGFYRVTMPIYTDNASGGLTEHQLYCTFGGGRVGPRFIAGDEDWSYTFFSSYAMSFSLESFTHSLELHGVSGISQDNAQPEGNPWKYIRLEPDSITIFYPRGDFMRAPYMRDAALTVTLDGRAVAVTGQTVRFAEDVVAVRYQLGERIANEGGKKLTFTRARVVDPNDAQHRWQTHWSPEVFDLHEISDICLDCGAVSRSYATTKCTRNTAGSCHYCSFPAAW